MHLVDVDAEASLLSELISQGKAAEVMSRLPALLKIEPNNLKLAWVSAQVLYLQGRYVESLQHIQSILSVDPNESVILSAVAVHGELGQLSEIQSLHNKYEDIFKASVPIMASWGYWLNRYSDFSKAEQVLRYVVGLDPARSVFWHNLATALAHQNKGEEAVLAFAKKIDFLDLENANTKTNYTEIAYGYDSNPLHTEIPLKLIGAYRKKFTIRRFGDVLDLGAGTGILGKYIVPVHRKRLVGIDLSAAMLEQARARNVYDQLIEGDLLTAMSALDQTFDTILSSGVFYHIADLAPVFTQAARLLNSGGVFAFSTDPDIDDHEVRATAPGEYAHSRRYLRRLAAETGLIERAITIAPHRGSPGFWCVFEKPASTG